MVKDIIDNVRDISLRVTLQLLYVLMHEPGKHNLNDLSEKTGYSTDMIYMAIKPCLSQSIFEFYSGDTRLNEDNISRLFNPHPEEKLFVVTRIDFTDEEGFSNFGIMLEDYRESVSKRKSFEKIAVFNSFRVADGIDIHGKDTSAIRLIAENRTLAYEYQIDGSRFYPLSIYSSRSYDQEYFVALVKEAQGYTIKFYPLKYSKPCINSVTGYMDVSKVYPDDIIIKARKVLKSIWGPYDMQLDEKPFNVIAVIYDENCLGKIRHDISSHRGKITDNGNGTHTLCLEVLGYEAFRTWTLSYGSSIEILEPKKLRKNLTKIYESVARNMSEKDVAEVVHI